MGKRLVIKLLVTCLLFGCQTLPPGSLYQSLGGEQKLNQIVEDFIDEIGHDPVVFPYFEKASVSHFRKGIYTHLCDIAGGPCKYTGDSMRDIHTGMNVSEKAFNRLVELLINAMDKNHVDSVTQNRLLAKLAPLRSEVMVDG